MSERRDDYDDLMSIAQAAKNVHMRREAVRDFAVKRGLTVQIGKRIKIPVTELRKQLARRSTNVLHPAVKC